MMSLARRLTPMTQQSAGGGGGGSSASPPPPIYAPRGGTPSPSSQPEQHKWTAEDEDAPATPSMPPPLPELKALKKGFPHRATSQKEVRAPQIVQLIHHIGKLLRVSSRTLVLVFAHPMRCLFKFLPGDVFQPTKCVVIN